MDLMTPYHVFVTIDHDRQRIRIFDDDRWWELYWRDGSEPMQVLIEPNGPRVLWRTKVEANQ